MRSQRSRYVGCSPVIELSATGTRGTLTMPRLDGVHQREVGDDPGKEGALPGSRSPQEERRRRQVVDGLDADLALDRLEAGHPDPRLFLALFGFVASSPVSFSLARALVRRRSPVRSPACGGSSGAPRR